MEDATVVATTIRQVVADTPTKTSTGGRIWEVIRTAHPDFTPTNFGTKNLRAFIRRFVTDVKERDRAGADILYGLENEPEDDGQQPASTTPLDIERKHSPRFLTPTMVL